MTQDKMRAEFEAWLAVDTGLSLDRCIFFTDDYESENTQSAWKAWQAAQKREPLSESVIDEIVLSTYACVSDSDAFSIVRATEAAHNITKD